MPNLMPGAVWRPVKNGGAGRPLRKKGRGVCLHVAVSEAASLAGYFATADDDSHFYVTKAGVIEQMIDADYVAYANLAGNGSLLSVETQGGVTNADAEPWTAAQVDALARIATWAHQGEGVPLALMPDSLPTSRGIGWHRLGVKPWTVAGGEVWSSALGKRCPGDAKIAQVADVVARANALTAGQPLPATPIVVPATPAGPPPPPPLPAWTLPRGHYYGLITGPAVSHGGIDAAERTVIQAIQRRLIAKRYVPGITDWRSGWADGRFEGPTRDAVARFQHAEMPGTTRFGEVWADDYARLGR